MNLTLDQYLDDIYITESVEKLMPMVKSNHKLIFDSMKKGNLIKVRRLLNRFSDIGLDELAAATQKKNPGVYNQAKSYIKGDSTELQKMYIVTYTSLKSIQESTNDEAVSENIDTSLEKLHDFTKKYAGRFIKQGFVLTILLWFIGFFFAWLPVIGLLIRTGIYVGYTLFWFGVLLMVVRLFLNAYFKIKGDD